MNDYERIARIIRYLEAHQQDQPDLDTLAAEVGLSPHHFHRLFVRWAGVTPKEFLQCLTFAYTRQRLVEGRSVLDASLDAGLSGPGRLHDLCVQLTAASPGEIKSGGAGWMLSGGFAETPFGLCFIGETPRGLGHLSFLSPGEESAALVAFQSLWPKAELVQDEAKAVEWAGRIFTPQSSPQTIRAFVKGSAFQVKVWEALLRIPDGQLVSYGTIAQSIGKAKATRAVGTAVGRNELSWLIPCHRVIRETGVLGNYRWGPERKKAMIAYEGIRG
jgi:AraC family transcriptional regulator of adaptative response/methylated-DNA-[protein]-cysteine methyltransferase